MIDATWFQDRRPADLGAPRRDVSVIGTTSAGRVVVPAALPGGPTKIGDD